MRTTPELEICIVTPIMVKIATAAEMMGVSAMTIYLWIREGKLKTIPVGTEQRIEVAELERYIRERRYDPPDPAKAAARSEESSARMTRAHARKRKERQRLGE